MRLHLEPDSLEATVGGRITGVLYFSDGTESFPDDEWNDFVDVVLAWWSDALANVNAGETASLAFMDGPYVVDISRDAGGRCTAVFRCLSPPRIVLEGRVDPAVLSDDIARARDVVVKFQASHLIFSE